MRRRAEVVAPASTGSKFGVLPGALATPSTRLDQPRLVGQDHRLYAIAQAELAQDPVDVRLDRPLADEQR
jgi:hypothetical protein